MEKKFKLGVIGAGFMSTAIVQGAIKSKVLNPTDIIVSDAFQGALDKMAKNGVSVTNDNAEVINSSDFTLFAVKPQSLSEVAGGVGNISGKKFISIMAGVKKDKIKGYFGNSLVARCMPNTPCSIGCGAVGVDISDFTDQKDVDFIKSLLSSFADVVFVAEEKLNAVTGVSGSSPAYFYLFLKGIIEAGVKNGLEYEEAKRLATATMIGAGKMVQNNPDKTLDELITAVCSKGGTTIEAINVYNEDGLSQITEKAVDSCIRRSIELENL